MLWSIYSFCTPRVRTCWHTYKRTWICTYTHRCAHIRIHISWCKILHHQSHMYECVSFTHVCAQLGTHSQQPQHAKIICVFTVQKRDTHTHTQAHTCVCCVSVCHCACAHVGSHVCEKERFRRVWYLFPCGVGGVWWMLDWKRERECVWEKHGFFFKRCLTLYIFV